MSARHPQDIDVDGLLARLSDLATDRRTIVAVAGPPGAGKSTLAEVLVDGLNAARNGMAALVPMDGFHFDDIVLNALGRRPRKGAPDTFDVGGLDHLLARLRARDEDFVAIPIFDRGIEIARAGARLVPADVPVIVVEGNYLLLDTGPWRALARHFDVTVLISVPEAELRRRLARRWEDLGLTPAQVTAKLEENDLPNGRTVATHSMAPDYVLRFGDGA